MTLQEIKQAVKEGKTVHWVNSRYTVKGKDLDNLMIACDNGSAIGLTWLDGVTLNGKESEFYVSQPI